MLNVNKHLVYALADYSVFTKDDKKLNTVFYIDNNVNYGSKYKFYKYYRLTSKVVDKLTEIAIIDENATIVNLNEIVTKLYNNDEKQYYNKNGKEKTVTEYYSEIAEKIVEIYNSNECKVIELKGVRNDW